MPIMGIKISCYVGYKGDTTKNYFRNYDEFLSDDFILSNGAKELRLLNCDIQDWRITFVDTSILSNIGQRLKAVQGHSINNGEELVSEPFQRLIKEAQLIA